jgi:hypothetical protein
MVHMPDDYPRLPQRRPSLRTATHSLFSAHISALVTLCLVEFAVLGMRDCNCPSVASNGFVTLLNEEREKAAGGKPSSDRRTPGVHRCGAEAAMGRS